MCYTKSSKGQRRKKQMAKHSAIVGGSTASRVIKCPASVALCAKMPPKPSSKYADEGTLLHNAIAEILDKDLNPSDIIGFKYKELVVTQELYDEKIVPALQRFDEIDPRHEMDFMVESEVDFGEYLPGVFGSADVIGRMGDKAIVLDWKFGSGVIVNAEENYQGMFYAAAAMRTEKTKWAFEGAKEIEIIIVQPPEMRRWVTTPARIKEFEQQLSIAVKEAGRKDAPIQSGSHCRWCNAKPVCPIMTDAVARSTQLALKDLKPDLIAIYLQQADVLEDWIKELRDLAHQMLEADVRVPGYKLVAKRAIRQWANEHEAAIALSTKGISPHKPLEVISPAQAEKLLGKDGKELIKDLVVAVSSGSTLVPESDPRPAVLQIGKQLTAALNKLN
jgi:hypothetical protein